MGALTCLCFELFEFEQLSLSRFVEQFLLDFGGNLDRENAEVAFAIELDRRVAGGAGSLFISSQQRVLESRDERPALDAFLFLDLAYGVDDLLAHCCLPFVDQIAPYELVIGDVDFIGVCRDANRSLGGGDNGAAEARATADHARRLERDASSEDASKMFGLAQRPLQTRRGDVDGVAVEVLAQGARHTLAESVVDSTGVVDIDAEPRRRNELDRKHLDIGKRSLDAERDLPRQLPLRIVNARQNVPS